MPIKIGNIEVYDIQELCKTFQVNETTLIECIENGRLKGQRLGEKWYVSSRVLEEFFESDYDKEMVGKIIAKCKPKLSDKLDRQGYFFPTLTPEIREILEILHREQIETFEDLCMRSPNELLAIKGFDESRLSKIKDYLSHIGFSLTTTLDEVKHMKIEDLGLLSVRARNVLNAAHIETFEDLCNLSPKELRAISHSIGCPS
jgi:hypothetical protein